jgi:hypothetical protein
VALSVSLLMWHGGPGGALERTGCSVARGGPTWANDDAPTLLEAAAFWRDETPRAASIACGASTFEHARMLLCSLVRTLPVAFSAGEVDDTSVSQMLQLYRSLRSQRAAQLSALDIVLCQQVLPRLLASLPGAAPLEQFVSSLLEV